MANYNTKLSVSENCRLVGQHAPILRQLTKRTNFTRMELEALLIIYIQIVKDYPMNDYGFRYFLYKVFGMTNKLLTDQMFHVLDRDRKRELSFEDWCYGMSTILRGNREEQMKFCFRVYDYSDQGFITRDIMLLFLKQTFINRSDDEAYEMAKELCEALIKKMDTDRNGRVDYLEYRACVLTNRNMIEFLGQCLPSRRSAHTFMSTLSPLPGRV